MKALTFSLQPLMRQAGSCQAAAHATLAAAVAHAAPAPRTNTNTGDSLQQGACALEGLDGCRPVQDNMSRAGMQQHQHQPHHQSTAPNTCTNINNSLGQTLHPEPCTLNPRPTTLDQQSGIQLEEVRT